MANTTSWAFPNMINATQNRVNLMTDERSVINRTRLLLLTETSELYNEPTFGAGLKRFLWQYNNENNRSIMKDRITEQIRMYEPCVDADNIEYIDTHDSNSDNQVTRAVESNSVKLAANLPITFGGTAHLDLDDEIVKWLTEEEYTDTDELALRY